MKGRLVTVWVIGVWRDEADDVTTQIQETMIDENTIHQLHAIWRSCDYWRRTCMNRHRWLSVLWRRRLTDRQIYRCATVAINSTKHRKHNDGPRPLAPHQFQQESPAIADKPARRESLPKMLQFDVPTTLSLTILAYLQHAFNCYCIRNPRNPEKFTENSNLWSSRSSKWVSEWVVS